jgi:hypothetical protein
MKFVMAVAFLFAGLSLRAEDLKTNPSASPLTQESKKMTTKDAKKTCKEMGKTGPELIKCMKEKKEEN